MTGQVDVSKIALAVDSTDVVRAKGDLDNLVPSADAVQKATERVTASTTQMGAGMSQASGAAVRSRVEMSDAAQKYISALEMEAKTLGESRAVQERYITAAMGFTRAEQDKAVAIALEVDALKAAEYATKQKALADEKQYLAGEAYIARLKEKVAIQQLDTRGVEAFRAAQLGVSAEAAPLLASLDAGAAKMAVHKAETLAAASALDHVTLSSAPVRRELGFLAGELARGDISRFERSLSVLGERMGLINILFSPVGAGFALVTAAIGAVGIAAYKGYEQLETLNKSLILSGNFAGVTAGSFDAMARSISQSTNATLGKTQEALQAIVSSGRFGPQMLAPVTEAVTRMAELSGEKAQKIVADFERMGDGVARYAAEHNRSSHLITAAQYEQIKALEDAGKKEEAQLMYFDLFNKRAATHEQDIGSIARAWRSATQWVSEYVQSWQNIGKGSSVPRQLEIEQSKLADLEKASSSKSVFGTSNSGRLDQEIAYTKETIKALENSQRLADSVAKATAENGRVQQAAIEASPVVRRLEEEVDKRDKATRKIEEYTVAVRKMREANDPMAPSPQKEAETIAALRSKGEGRISSAGNRLVPEDVDLEKIKKDLQTEDSIYASREKMISLYRSRGLSSDAEYYAARQASQQEALEKTTAIFAREKALLEGRISGARTNDERIKFTKELIAEQEKYNVAVARIAQSGAEDAITRIGNAARDAAKLMEQDTQAVARQLEVQEKLVQAERVLADAVGKTKQQIEAEKIARLELAAALQQQRIATMEAFGFDAQTVEQQRLRLALLQEEIGLKKRSLAATQDFATGAREAITKYQESAAGSAATAEKAVSGGITRLEDAIVNFAKTGKLSFSGLFQYMADEYIRQQARMLIAGSGGSGGGGLLGAAANLIGSYLGGGGYSYNGGVGTTNAAGISGGRASGGSVNAGQNYLVGEQGPEILRMGSAGGTVIPNDQISGGASRSVTLNVINNGQPTKATQSQRETSQGTVIDLVLDAVAADMAGGGRVHDATSRRFGLNPGGTTPRY